MNLDILEELHAEKRWLETMIGALEIASRSPAQRFATTLATSLARGRTGGSALNLGKQQRIQLIRLAGQVRKICSGRIYDEPDRLAGVRAITGLRRVQAQRSARGNGAGRPPEAIRLSRPPIRETPICRARSGYAGHARPPAPHGTGLPQRWTGR